MRKRTGLRLAVAVLLCFVSLAYANDTTALLRAADRSLAEHRYTEARSLYDKAIAQGAELDNDLPRARNAATAYLCSTPPDPAKAIRWLRLVLAQDPQAEATRLELAEALRLQGDLPGAIATYQTLVEAHPQSAEYVVALATTMRDAGQKEEAIQLLRTYLERNTSSLRVRLEFARLLNFSQQFVEAKQQFRIILAADPQNLFAELGLAKASSFSGDQEGALEIYNRLLRRQPGWYDAQVGKAFALFWSGHKQAAYDLFRQAHQRHPEDEEVGTALAGHTESAEKLPQRPSKSVSVPEVVSTRARASQPVSEGMALTAPKVSAPPPTAAGKSAPREISSAGIVWSQLLKYFGIGIVFVILADLVLKVVARHRKVRLTTATASREPDSADALACTTPSVPASAPEDETTSQSTPFAPAKFAADTQTRYVALNKGFEDSPSAAIGPKSGPGADPVQATDPSHRKVLLVGGSPDLLEFECNWLAAHNAETIVECDWLPALVRLLNTPPDVLVLNGTTSDDWTCPRIVVWLSAQPGAWAGPTLAILGKQEATQLPTTVGDNLQVLIEPFTGRQWEQMAEVLLSEDRQLARS